MPTSSNQNESTRMNQSLPRITRTPLTGDIGSQQFEKRLTRAQATTKLATLCRRLDAKHEVRASAERYRYGPKCDFEARASSLSVFGSYARGSATCGDLDVLVDGSFRWIVSDEEDLGGRERRIGRTQVKALIGSMPHATIYAGNAQDNSSGLSIEAGLVPIWTGPGCDWESAIASIKEDASAGHHSRKTDVAPFRQHQMGLSVIELEHLVDLRGAGIHDWRFYPLAKEDYAPFGDVEHESPDTFLLRSVNVAQRKTVPGVTRILRSEIDDWNIDAFTDDYSAGINMGGISVRVGKFEMTSRDIENFPAAFHSFALAADYSAQGPNGVWLISRGENHPHVKMLGDKVFYGVIDNGAPALTLESFGDTRYVAVQYLYSDRDQAEDHMAMLDEFTDGPDESSLEVVPYSGAALFRRLAAAPCVNIDNKPLRLRIGQDSWEGPQDVSSNADVWSALGVIPQNDSRLDTEAYAHKASAGEVAEGQF